MSEPNSPLVSVIIPVFNGRETICRAIDSVLAQSYREREVIVVDDGSTDSTIRVLRDYGSKIRLVEQKHAGNSTARNQGIKLARGEYVAFLDHDDFWVQEKLAVQVEILNRYPSVGLTFSNLEIVNKQGERLGSTFVPSHLRYAPSWKDLLKEGAVLLSSVLVRREMILKVGGFDAHLFTQHGYEDTDFFLRLRELTDFHYLDVCLGYYCYDKGHGLRQLTNLLLFARKYWNHPGLNRDSDRRLRDQFVERRTGELIWRMRLLMESEGGRISQEMLERLNGFHESFKSLFGESYKRVTGLDSITLSRYELNPTISLLLYLYLCRSDLQTAFPDVGSGDISKLVEWATSVAQSKEGVHSDSDRPILLAHLHELEQLTEKSKGSPGPTSRLRTLTKAVGFRSH